MQTGGTSCALVGVEEVLASCSTNNSVAGHSSSAVKMDHRGRTASGGGSEASGSSESAFSNASAVTYFVRHYVKRLENDLYTMSEKLNRALAKAKIEFCTDEEKRCRVRVNHTDRCATRSAMLVASIHSVRAEFEAARKRVAAEAPSYAARLLGGITAKRAGVALLALATAVEPASVEWPCTRALDLDVEFEAAIAHLDGLRKALARLSAEDRDKVSSEVLSKTRVVFCTLAGAGSSAVRRMVSQSQCCWSLFLVDTPTFAKKTKTKKERATVRVHQKTAEVRTPVIAALHTFLQRCFQPSLVTPAPRSPLSLFSVPTLA